MVLVRMVFQGKMGKAQEIVRAMKEMAGVTQSFGGKNLRILTDLSGNFDTVVQEMEFESIDAYFQAAERMFADPRFQQGMGSGENPTRSGYKEFFTIEYGA